MPDGDHTPEGWSSRDKFAAVLETAALSEAEVAEYCRKRGLYPEQIRAWRSACEQANDWDPFAKLGEVLELLWKMNGGKRELFLVQKIGQNLKFKAATPPRPRAQAVLNSELGVW